ncbi:uncharacterized protein LOC134258004 [Saccostrea cucullata]|uniref:uncharacterized protein LOC134258004 n=1 Tax=Saccostrea cuccullata TaxID=36930 RepID=UPI002ED66149
MYYIQLVLEEVDELLGNYSSFNYSEGLWVGAFLRSSNNEIMLENCDHLDSDIPVNITGISPDGMFCLYYNPVEQKLVTENCTSAKMFICEKDDEDFEECMINSSLSALRFQSQLCSDEEKKNLSLKGCEEMCLENTRCYTFTHQDKDKECKLYKYDDKKSCSPRNPLPFCRYKSIFLNSSEGYATSEDFPLDQWCPEVTRKVIQEKIANMQKNLTINRKETNQYIRTLTSAPDERTSSKNIGVLGAFVIGAVGSIFILSDCINLIKWIQNNRVRARNF